MTASTADLVYQGESGALNESMSDVFGAMIERYTYGENNDTWRLFERTLTPKIAGDAERDMANPHLGRTIVPPLQGQPDHYAGATPARLIMAVCISTPVSQTRFFHLVAKGLVATTGVDRCPVSDRIRLRTSGIGL
ncbi:MAG: M4 family metallopeptidase [Pseudomonadales bacterium]